MHQAALDTSQNHILFRIARPSLTPGLFMIHYGLVADPITLSCVWRAYRPSSIWSKVPEVTGLGGSRVQVRKYQHTLL